MLEPGTRVRIRTLNEEGEIVKVEKRFNENIYLILLQDEDLYLGEADELELSDF